MMSIFQRIENFSYRLADKIGKGDTEDEIELYRYSVFMICSELFSTITNLVLAIIFGYWVQYLVNVVVFAALRRGAGGSHCPTFASCYFTTTITFIISCVLSILFVDYYCITFLVAIVGAIFIFPICPKPSENSPTRGYKEDIRFRKIYRNWLLIFLFVDLTCIHFGFYTISSAINFAILNVVFAVSDTGEKIINFFLKLFHVV